MALVAVLLIGEKMKNGRFCEKISKCFLLEWKCDDYSPPMYFDPVDRKNIERIP